MTKNCTRFISKMKVDQEEPFYYFFKSQRLVLLQLFECFVFEYISFSTSPAPNCYDYSRFSVCLRFTYSLLRWTGAVWRSEPVHLGEPFQTHIIHSFTYKGFYHFTKWMNGLILIHCEKIPKFHLISWCGNFVERYSFRVVSGD